MSGSNEFKNLMHEVLAGSSEAASRLFRDYRLRVRQNIIDWKIGVN